MCDKQVDTTRTRTATQPSGQDLDWTELFPDGKLYGRDRQTAQLRNYVFHDDDPNNSNKRRHRQQHLAVITGKSGSGKTSLAVTSLRGPVESVGGGFLQGKFEQFKSYPHQDHQYYPIVQALTSFVQNLLNNVRKNEDRREEVKEILRKITEDEGVLLDAVPAFRQLLHENNSNSVKEQQRSDDENEKTTTATTSDTKGVGVQNRFIYSLCRFFRAICSPQHPFILFVDDIQWADPATLSVLTGLIVDKTLVDGLFVVFAVRGNEVNFRHHVSASLRELEGNHVHITTIVVSDLDVVAINTMVSDLLQMPEQDTRSLAECVCLQTDGNIFFSCQYLRALQEEGFLQYNPHSQRWVWDADDDKIILKLDFQDAIRLLTNKIRQMAPLVQEVLATAACLGAQFEVSLLEHLFEDNTKVLRDALQVATEKGLIRPDDGGGLRYRFCHDQIQQSSYWLIPEEECALAHLSIGRKLYRSLPKDRLETFLSIIVCQLSRGAHLMTKQDERDEMARLCLLAAEHAIKSSSFLAAGTYLEVGISVLGRRHWRDEYHLSLDLFNAAIEVEYCNGNLDRMKCFLSEVLQNARNFEDKIRAYTAAIYALGSRSERKKAIDLGVEVLNNLGESLPPYPSKVTTQLELRRTRALMNQYTDEAILELPRMTDKKLLAATRIMCTMVPYAQSARPDLMRLIGMKIIQNTCIHGLSPMSSVGFGSFSTFFCEGDNRDLGVRAGYIANKIVDRLQSKEWLGRVYVSTYGHSLKQEYPLRDILKPLLTSHRISLACGDTEMSMWSAAIYARTALFVATPLRQLQKEMETFFGLMRLFQQTTVMQFMVPTYRFCMAMMGRKAFDVESALSEAGEKKVPSLITIVYTFNMILCYHFEKYHEAEEYSRKLENCRSGLKSYSSFSFSYLYLYQGLVALAGRSLGRRHIATAKLKKLSKLGIRRPASFQNKISLLEGELLASKGMMKQALCKFGESVKYAKEECIICEEALACERAAVALARENRTDDSAKIFWARALALYEEWGAIAKVEYIREVILCEPVESGRLTNESSSVVSFTCLSSNESHPPLIDIGE